MAPEKPLVRFLGNIPENHANPQNQGLDQIKIYGTKKPLFESLANIPKNHTNLSILKIKVQTTDKIDGANRTAVQILRK